MTDASGGENESTPRDDAPAADGQPAPDEETAVEPEDIAAEVEAEYDFEDFGPRQMAEMDATEWEAAFDPDTWITGRDLLDRVEADLRHRVATRDVFAVVERDTKDGEDVVLAYSDEGYALVSADGTVEGTGTVLRDVKPTVALCSMDDYDVPDAPEHAGLPDPQAVPDGSTGLGTNLLKYVGIAQVVAGVLLFFAPFVYDPLVRTCPSVVDSTARACSIAGTTLNLHPLGRSGVVAAIAGIGFAAFGVFMLVLVANARLSDRFRAEEFRNRLRSAGLGDGERPAFVPETDSHQTTAESDEEAA